MWRRVLGSRWLYAVAAVALIALTFVPGLRLGRDPRPSGGVDDIAALPERDDLNLLFILIDTLRADRLAVYGYGRPTSPTIDALAADGVRFARQMSQSSWTKCSMASLWTGRYPIRTGVTRSPQALPEEAHMPAEILSEAGFRTFAIWRNGWISPRFGFSQGFEVYHSPRASPLPATVRRERPTIGVTGTDQDTVASAMEFLRAHGNERWFLYLHLMDVHQYVYDADTALFGTRYSDIYDNAIRWVDRVVGSLIRDIDARGLRDRTLIVLAADHGEAFGEHGREGHARDVYGEVTTTPWIISFPFRLGSAVVVDTPTQNVDLWPTVLDLLGLPGLEAPDGQSRRAEILAAARGERLPESDGDGFSHIDQTWGRTKRRPQPMVAVREGPYRLVRRAGQEKGELYDRSQDPYEQVDIGDAQPEVRERLDALVGAYLERKPDWKSGGDVELDASELEQLRALGYGVQ